MSSPCVRGAPRGRISGAERRSGVMSAGRRLRWVSYRRPFFAESGCNRSFAGIHSAAGVAAEAPGGVYLGKIRIKVTPGCGGVGDGRLKDDVPAPKRSRSQVKGDKGAVSGPAQTVVVAAVH